MNEKRNVSLQFIEKISKLALIFIVAVLAIIFKVKNLKDYLLLCFVLIVLLLALFGRVKSQVNKPPFRIRTIEDFLWFLAAILGIVVLLII